MKKFSSSISSRLTGRHKYSFKFSGSVKGKTVLDVGSSFGWFEKFATASGVKKIIGIEPDETFYKAKREVPKATFKQGSALNIPEKNGSFDLVVMFDVIEHLPIGTEIRALKEIHRVLKPGGTFAMSTDFDRTISKIMDPAWYFGHRHYTHEKLKSLFEKSGLKIVKFETRGGFFEITGTILLYIFKWIFKSEIPFKAFFERQKDIEYLNRSRGIVTIFVKATKPIK